MWWVPVLAASGFCIRFSGARLLLDDSFNIPATGRCCAVVVVSMICGKGLSADGGEDGWAMMMSILPVLFEQGGGQVEGYGTCCQTSWRFYRWSSTILCTVKKFLWRIWWSQFFYSRINHIVWGGEKCMPKSRQVVEKSVESGRRESTPLCQLWNVLLIGRHSPVSSIHHLTHAITYWFFPSSYPLFFSLFLARPAADHSAHTPTITPFQ